MKRKASLSNEERLRLRALAEALFIAADRHHLHSTRAHYLRMKKLYAALSKAEPRNPQNYQWMAVAGGEAADRGGSGWRPVRAYGL